MTGIAPSDRRVERFARLADVSAAHHRSPLKTQAVGLLVAAIVQMVVIAALVLAIRIPQIAEAPAMIVNLTPDFFVKPEQQLRRAVPHRQPNLSKVANAPTAQGRNAEEAQATASVVTPQLAPPDINAGLAAALRGSVGCVHADTVRLSASERRECDRLARSHGRAFETAHFGIDSKTRAVFDEGAKRDAWFQQPFLAEKPTKGCRPRVTEENLPTNGGRPAQDWTLGASCGVPF